MASHSLRSCRFKGLKTGSNFRGSEKRVVPAASVAAPNNRPDSVRVTKVLHRDSMKWALKYHFAPGGISPLKNATAVSTRTCPLLRLNRRITELRVAVEELLISKPEIEDREPASARTQRSLSRQMAPEQTEIDGGSGVWGAAEAGTQRSAMPAASVNRCMKVTFLERLALGWNFRS